jgi:hypothetical protein
VEPKRDLDEPLNIEGDPEDVLTALLNAECGDDADDDNNEDN